METSGARPYTAGQVVSYNFKRARLHRRWKMEEAAKRLAPYVGAEWTRGNISSLESSQRTGARRIDVDDLVAFARGFNLPLVWFFLPPPNMTALVGAPVERKRGEKARTPVEQAEATPTELMALLFGGPPTVPLPWEEEASREDGWADLKQRLAELPSEFLSRWTSTRTRYRRCTKRPQSGWRR